MERAEDSVPDYSLFGHISYGTGNGSFILNEHSEDAENAENYRDCITLMNRCLAYSESKDPGAREALEKSIESLESKAEESKPEWPDPDYAKYAKKRYTMMAKIRTADVTRVYLSFVDGKKASLHVPQWRLNVLITRFEQLEQQNSGGKGPKVFLDQDSKQRLAQLTMEEMNGWVWDLDDYRLFCHYADSGMSLKGVEKGFGQLSINPAGPEGDAMES
jgi:hypothetical protein